jgi:glutaredoxin
MEYVLYNIILDYLTLDEVYKIFEYFCEPFPPKLLRRYYSKIHFFDICIRVHIRRINNYMEPYNRNVLYSSLIRMYIDYFDDRMFLIKQYKSKTIEKFKRTYKKLKKQMGDIKIYTKSGCKYCDKAKILFDDNDLVYTTIHMDKYSEEDYNKKRHNLITTTGSKTFPWIFVGDEYVGGFKELEYEMNTMKFHDRLKNIGIDLEIDF